HISICLLSSPLHPVPTPSPYTTLFRSIAYPPMPNTERIALVGHAISLGGEQPLPGPGEANLFAAAIAEAKRYNLGPGRGCSPPRSEEHTSELQSRENLVCRLLLEKKKN